MNLKWKWFHLLIRKGLFYLERKKPHPNRNLAFVFFIVSGYKRFQYIFVPKSLASDKDGQPISELTE